MKTPILHSIQVTLLKQLGDKDAIDPDHRPWITPRILQVYFHSKDKEISVQLAVCPLLAPEWRQTFAKRARGFSF
ncbi:hypothetical protein [Nostoc sp. PCC 7107]|uniref:hypothetical protein n=1 Tax=Nostoc sp. PCC 7107 TaxID=317936 RepID=UPI0005CB4D5C|nr:hypothetical protein [Nostoc sp. PCC 7107]